MRWLAAAAAALLLSGCGGGSLPSLEDARPPEPSETASTDPAEPLTGPQIGSSPGQPIEIAADQPNALTAEQRADVETGVRRKLTDPQSAMFGSMQARVSRNTASAFIVCGWISSKNSAGGFSGDQPFIAMYAPKLRTALLIGIGDEQSRSDAVKRQCSAQGVPLG